MNQKEINKIFCDTAYVRTGGSAEEKRTAEYIKDILAEKGLSASLEPFKVAMANMASATLTVNGREIPCKGYFLSGSGEVEAPIYYLRSDDRLSLSGCKGKIILFDGYLGYWKYRDIFENGALGFISYDGHVNYSDRDVDQRELRPYVSKGDKILGVNINAKDAVSIIKNGGGTARISILQDEYESDSHNVILEIPGERDEYITFTAHYDTTSLSEGAYDNMSGAICLIALAEKFKKQPLKYSLRFIWCGSEERGLLGSKAYCAEKEDELSKTVLNINIDMIGSIMGKFIACCTTEARLVDYLSYMGDELGFQISPYQDVYSSDSTPFADKGVPAVSFARTAPGNTATIHNSYDTKAVMSERQMAEDIEFIAAFAERMGSSHLCPVSRVIPDSMKEKLDEYLARKRKKD